jgi:hypothetical protein
MTPDQIASATLPLPATQRVGSDSYACAVVGRSPSGKTITVRRRNRPDAQYSWRAGDGVFRARGARPVRGCFVCVGEAVEQMDPHF